MTIIHVGDGRHITLDEGAIFRPPPPVKPKYVYPHRTVSTPLPGCKDYKSDKPVEAISGDNHWSKKRAKIVTGFDEWWLFKNSVMAKYRDSGRKVGEGPGIRKKKAGYLWGWAKRKAKKDLEKIMEVYPDTDEVAQEALKGALEVLRGPQTQGYKLQAAKLLLEFTKAKPVSKSEVSVNAAEAWLASLGKDDAD